MVTRRLALRAAATMRLCAMMLARGAVPAAATTVPRLLAALPVAMARPYLGAWVKNASLRPVFDRRLLGYAPDFHEHKMHRDRKCDTGRDASWRWAWRPHGAKKPMRLRSDDGLCAALKGVRVINFGDSLTHQLVETWRARRIARDWPVPANFTYVHGKDDGNEDGLALANNFSRQTRGGRRRLGPKKRAHEEAERAARQRVGDAERCANGAAFQFVEPQRPWSLVPHAFREHDPSVVGCGVSFRNQTADFATHKASEYSIWRAIFGKDAVEKDKKKREKKRVRHERERVRAAVVYNCFAHIGSVALEVAECYAREAPDRFNSTRAAYKLALADVASWWRFEAAAMARALSVVAVKARDLLGVELRSFYRTSPPAADRWLHRARYEVRFGVIPLRSVLRLPSEAPGADGARREKHPSIRHRRDAPHNAGTPRRKGPRGLWIRAPLQGGLREGVRQVRAERRDAERKGGHDGVRAPASRIIYGGSCTLSMR